MRAGFILVSDLASSVQTFRTEAAGALVPAVWDRRDAFCYASNRASERAYAAGEGLAGAIVVVPFCVADAVKIRLARSTSEK